MVKRVCDVETPVLCARTGRGGVVLVLDHVLALAEQNA